MSATPSLQSGQPAQVSRFEYRSNQNGHVRARWFTNSLLSRRIKLRSITNGNRVPFMALLQPRLTLKVSQRQVLTPGLMQMVSVLALNKMELKEMIDAEMVENPVLEEIDESVPMLDEVAGREEVLERTVEEAAAPPKDVFSEIDFGSYF